MARRSPSEPPIIPPDATTASATATAGTIAGTNPSSSSQSSSLSGTEQERIRRLVLYGATARELVEEFHISPRAAHHYIHRWQRELRACRQDEREVARGILLNIYDKAQEMYELARQATQPPPATATAPRGANGQESSLPASASPVPAPDFEAMAQALDKMADCAQKLGEFSHLTGAPGVARIKAASEEGIELLKQEFAIDHPDRIPGLGFGQPATGPFNGFANLPAGSQAMLAVVMPKSAEGERLERERLGLPPGKV